jgi:CubicO group peptidase (beta-lactamase class C family)
VKIIFVAMATVTHLCCFGMSLHGGSADNSAGSRIDSLISGLHHRGFFDGAVVVSRDSQIVYEKGFGLANVERKLRFTPSTPTECASLLKTFVAASILLLQDEGQLDLDDSVRKYIHVFPYAEPTVRDLLTHSSGLPDYEYFEEFLTDGEPWSPNRLLNILNTRKPRLKFVPGKQFEYNNFCYDLLELIVEQVTGKGFDAFVRQRIFDPLELSSALFPPPRYADYPGIRTMSYNRVDGKLNARPIEDDGDEIYNLHISAHDLSLWGASFFEDKILSERVMKIGLSRAVLGSGKVSGLNLLSWYSSDNGTAYWYSGHYNGFYSLLYWDAKQGYSISFVSNTNIPMWLRPQLVTALVKILDGHPVKKLSPPAATIIDSLNLPQIESGYSFNDGRTIQIDIREQQTYLRSNQELEYQMFQVDNEAFYVPGIDAWIWFSSTDESPVGTIHWTTVLGKQIGTRAEPSHGPK